MISRVIVDKTMKSAAPFLGSARNWYSTNPVRNDSGATAIEYGLIAAGISVVIIAAVQATGANLTGTFQTV